MTVSENGIKLIKEFEGCRLTAYRDIVGVLTIGYGNTNYDKDIIGEITDGMVITQKKADEWLRKTLEARYVPKVHKYQEQYRFNQNEFDALVSYAYNIGSIDKLVDYGKRSIAEISADIPNHNHAGGKVVKGLTMRRNKERELFDTPTYKVGWNQDEGGWFYSPDGKRYLYNEWKVINRHKYRFSDRGYIERGWEKIDEKWYYFEPSGNLEGALYLTDKDGVQSPGVFE